MATPIDQLLSRTIYLTDGTTTVWDFSFSGGYLDVSHVKAYTETPAGIRTAVTGTLIGAYQLQITPVLTSGDTLVIYRDTPKNLPLVDFTDESGFSEIALDTNAKQAVFIAAEGADLLALTDLQAAFTAAESAGLSADSATASKLAAAASRAAADLDAAATAADRVAVTANYNNAVAIYDGIVAVNAAVTSASGSATSAAGSATAASNSATAASGSATASANSATASSNSATAASGSATAANGSAVAAAASESAAAGSASAASGSAAAAAASYDAFDDRWLGSKAVAPTVDNDGNSLIVGSVYWDTVINGGTLRVWNGSWVTVPASNWATSGANMDITSLGAVTSINGGQLGGMRNRIINGKMEIAQRGTSFAAPASGAYSLDRWLSINVTSAVFTISQQTDVPSSNEFQNSLRAEVTTADASIASGDVYTLEHTIEGYNVRDLIGRTFTLSFWVRSSKTGVHAVSFASDTGDRSYVVEYTINSANTWEYKTATVSGGLITAGTWNWTNGLGLRLRFALAAGTAFQTTANAWQTGNFLATANQVNCLDTIGNIFAITGVQLEAGSVATPFEHRPYGVELALCQRYYYRKTAASANAERLGAGLIYNTTTAQILFNYPVPLRAMPSQYGIANITNCLVWTGANYIASAYAPDSVGLHALNISVTMAAGAAAGQAAQLTRNSVATPAPYFEVGAEL